MHVGHWKPLLIALATCAVLASPMLGDRAVELHLVERFALDGCGVAFAVLGGSFAEGVDLVGTRLVGVFIATMGLPQMTEVHPIKIPESEDGLGIGSWIEGCQILDNLHRSSHCVSVWSVVHAVGWCGTITMPEAGRNRKARSGALVLKNTLDIGQYSKYKTPFARR